MGGCSGRVVPKWSTTPTGKSSLVAVVLVLVFLTYVMHVYYF